VEVVFKIVNKLDSTFSKSYSVRKSLMNRTQLIKLKPSERKELPHLWKYFIKLFLDSVFKSKKVSTISNFIFSQGTSEELRINHVHAQCPEIDIKSIRAYRKDELIYQKRNIKSFFRKLKLTWCFISVYLKNRKYLSKHNVAWLPEMYRQLLQIIMLSDSNIRMVFYYAFTPTTYICSYLATSLYRNEGVLLTSNTTVFPHNRYTYLPKCNLGPCSKFQLIETDNFIRNNWINVKAVELWGLEEVDVYSRLIEQNAEYDICIYSSGSWARNENLFRVRDINLLRSYKYLDTPGYKMFFNLIELIVKLKSHNKKLNIIVYPHPYERKLFLENEIAPPYLKLLEQNSIDFDITGENSIGNIYKSKVSISVSSTMTTDRWHLGLPAFIFDGRQKEYEKIISVRREYVGGYQKYCYSSMEELESKLNFELTK
jgi:hypothetical protein